MMDSSSVPIGELLPHGPEMTLIERLTEYSPQRSVATVAITPQSRFVAADGVPAWVGIEYMAQTIAAHAGYEGRLRGQPPAIGFLLGTRAYRSDLAVFPLGAKLTISVEPLVADAKLGAFQCVIATDRVVATAVVNTYQPSADELAVVRRGAATP
jgi:predicted hotdog family 3-hydroxylacyl-ACP dehydratase